MTALNQMRYYRGVVVPKIAKHRKTDADEAHEWAKKEFFKKSTTLFTEDGFEEKLSEIRSRMSAEGVWIPLPNEEDLPPTAPEDGQELHD